MIKIDPSYGKKFNKILINYYKNILLIKIYRFLSIMAINTKIIFFGMIFYYYIVKITN
jgi:hypothetical protein